MLFIAVHTIALSLSLFYLSRCPGLNRRPHPSLTPSLLATRRRARLYIHLPEPAEMPLSVVRARIPMCATVLAGGAINRYSGFIPGSLLEWAGFASHHGCALPTELHRRMRRDSSASLALRYPSGLSRLFQFMHLPCAAYTLPSSCACTCGRLRWRSAGCVRVP